MEWYTYILIGFIIGMITMYQLVRPDLGDDISFKGKIKKSNVRDLTNNIDLTKTKERRKLRDIFKRKNRKQ